MGPAIVGQSGGAAPPVSGCVNTCDRRTPVMIKSATLRNGIRLPYREQGDPELGERPRTDDPSRAHENDRGGTPTSLCLECRDNHDGHRQERQAIPADP
jgi:hypothetical protein